MIRCSQRSSSSPSLGTSGPAATASGAFPPEWSEWNDAFRRTLRRYWAGEGELIGEMATRMTGSADIFEHHRPHAAGEHQPHDRA